MKCFKYSFLFEIISQEIPAQMQKLASEKLAEIWFENAKKFFIFLPINSPNKSLDKSENLDSDPKILFENLNANKEKLNLENNSIKFYYSTSRIAFKADLLIFSDFEEKIIKGPPVLSNSVEIIIQKFLEKNNASKEDLFVISEKGINYNGIKKINYFNKNLNQILENLNLISLKSLNEMKWPNSMHYEGSDHVSWIRPLMNILAIIEGADKVAHCLDFSFANIKSGNETIGHKILSVKDSQDMIPKKIEINHISDYTFHLKSNFIIPSSAERLFHIISSSQKKSPYFENYLENSSDKSNIVFKKSAEHIKSLINELIGIADWPNILVCKIDTQFMHLPRELIEYVMISHQRYIPLINGKSELCQEFLVVIDHTEGSDLMRVGYERVLFARLLDAKFFYERFLNTDYLAAMNDLIKEKNSEIANLSIFDHNLQICNLAKEILKKNVGISEIEKKSINLNEKFLNAAKIDLCFDLILEYPALRGIMSSYFWKNKKKLVLDELIKFFGNDEKFDEKIESIGKNIYYNAGEVYKRDILDKDDVTSRFFGITEKIIKLRYFFYEKEQNPTGSRDPFALKRDLHNLIDMSILDAFDKNEIKDNKFNFDLYEIFFHCEKDDQKSKENRNNLINFVYKNLEQSIFIFFIETIFEKKDLSKNDREFLKNLIDWALLELKNNNCNSNKILSLLRGEKLNLIKIIQFIFYLFNLRNDIDLNFKEAYKRISQIYSKKYLNYEIQKDLPAFSLKEELDLLELILKIEKSALNSKDDYQIYIKKILEHQSDLSSKINDFLDNVFIEDEDDAKKNARIFLLKKTFDLIDGIFPFSMYFSKF